MMAEQWIDDYQAFKTWIAENLGPCPKGHSIDRIFNDEDYAPGNLRWAPPPTQALNSRRSRFNKELNAFLLECLADKTISY
jgi:hypothetical protein